MSKTKKVSPKATKRGIPLAKKQRIADSLRCIWRDCDAMAEDCEAWDSQDPNNWESLVTMCERIAGELNIKL